MDDDENYRFDISGFIVLPGVLSPGEVAACNEAIDKMLGGGDDLPLMAGACDSLLQLRDHPVLVGYAEALCGEGYRPDTGPTLLGTNGKTDDVDK